LLEVDPSTPQAQPCPEALKDAFWRQWSKIVAVQLDSLGARDCNVAVYSLPLHKDRSANGYLLVCKKTAMCGMSQATLNVEQIVGLHPDKQHSWFM